MALVWALMNSVSQKSRVKQVVNVEIPWFLGYYTYFTNLKWQFPNNRGNWMSRNTLLVPQSKFSWFEDIFSRNVTVNFLTWQDVYPQLGCFNTIRMYCRNINHTNILLNRKSIHCGYQYQTNGPEKSLSNACHLTAPWSVPWKLMESIHWLRRGACAAICKAQCMSAEEPWSPPWFLALIGKNTFAPMGMCATTANSYCDYKKGTGVVKDPW